MAAALHAIDAKLKQDLGSGIEGPAGPVSPVDKVLLVHLGRALSVLASDALRAAQEREDRRKARFEETLAAERERRDGAIHEAQREAAARIEAEARIAEALRQSQAEREAMLKAHDEALAHLNGTYAEEREALAFRAAESERLAQEQRTRAETAETQLRAAPPAALKPPKGNYRVEVTPHTDGAGILRRFVLKSERQTLEVNIVRDGADEPILMEINPK